MTTDKTHAPDTAGAAVGAQVDRGVRPVAWRHSLTHSLHHTENEVQLADAESVAEPLYLATAERAWLVEWKAHGYGPQWWGFNHDPGRYGDWCADANKAIRFSRREDAERMRLHVIAVAGLTGNHAYERNITVTEHEWPNASVWRA